MFSVTSHTSVVVVQGSLTKTLAITTWKLDVTDSRATQSELLRGCINIWKNQLFPYAAFREEISVWGLVLPMVFYEVEPMASASPLDYLGNFHKLIQNSGFMLDTHLEAFLH